MPGTLADALQQVRLITEKEKKAVLGDQASRLDREAATQLRKLTSKHGRSANLDRLEICSSIGEFKDTAKKLLNEHPDYIQDVITQAHRFKTEQGGDRLIQLVYKVKDRLPRLPTSERERFLRRAFRRSGGTVEIK